MTVVRISRGKPLRAWVFDVEARPGPWLNADLTTKRMLSIAGAWEDDLDGTMRYLGPGFTAGQLEEMVQPLRQGCLVVAHNGPRYDLPFLNGTLMRLGLQPLRPQLVSDTLMGIPRRGRAFSGSLRNMAQRFGVEQPKGDMSEPDWDDAYDGVPAALEKLRIYNIGDVQVTAALRARLLELGLLKPPKVWRG